MKLVATLVLLGSVWSAPPWANPPWASSARQNPAVAKEDAEDEEFERALQHTGELLQSGVQSLASAAENGWNAVTGWGPVSAVGNGWNAMTGVFTGNKGQANAQEPVPDLSRLVGSGVSVASSGFSAVEDARDREEEERREGIWDAFERSSARGRREREERAELLGRSEVDAGGNVETPLEAPFDVDPENWDRVDTFDPAAMEHMSLEDLERATKKHESEIDKSKKRMMNYLAESEQVAAGTLQKLHQQKEQIRRIKQDQHMQNFHFAQTEHYANKLRGFLPDKYHSAKKGLANLVFGRQNGRGVERAVLGERMRTHECCCKLTTQGRCDLGEEGNPLASRHWTQQAEVGRVDQGQCCKWKTAGRCPASRLAPEPLSMCVEPGEGMDVTANDESLYALPTQGEVFNPGMENVQRAGLSSAGAASGPPATYMGKVDPELELVGNTIKKLRMQAHEMKAEVHQQNKDIGGLARVMDQGQDAIDRAEETAWKAGHRLRLGKDI